jgi:hypothetical protein
VSLTCLVSSLQAGGGIVRGSRSGRYRGYDRLLYHNVTYRERFRHRSAERPRARIGRDSSRLRKMVAGSRCARDTTKPRLNRTLPDSPTEDALSGLPGVMVRCNRTEVETPQPIDVPPKVAGRPGRSTERNGINIRAPSMHVARTRAAAAPGSRRTD